MFCLCVCFVVLLCFLNVFPPALKVNSCGVGLNGILYLLLWFLKLKPFSSLPLFRSKTGILAVPGRKSTVREQGCNIKLMLVSIKQLSGSAGENATHFCGSTAGGWDHGAFPAKLAVSISSSQWGRPRRSWLGASERFLDLGSLSRHFLQPLLPFIRKIWD